MREEILGLKEKIVLTTALIGKVVVVATNNRNRNEIVFFLFFIISRGCQSRFPHIHLVDMPQIVMMNRRMDEVERKNFLHSTSQPQMLK